MPDGDEIVGCRGPVHLGHFEPHRLDGLVDDVGHRIADQRLFQDVAEYEHLGQILEAELGHPVSAVRNVGDVLLGLKGFQRLPDGDARHPELFGEGVLDDPAARRELPAGDVLPDRLGDGLLGGLGPDEVRPGSPARFAGSLIAFGRSSRWHRLSLSTDIGYSMRSPAHDANTSHDDPPRRRGMAGAIAMHAPPVPADVSSGHASNAAAAAMCLPVQR